MRQALAIAVVVCNAALASAQPILRVRAHTRLEIESIRRAPGDNGRIRLLVRGRLSDADLGEALRDGTVAIDLKGANGFYQLAVPTGDDGRFVFDAPLQPGEYRLRIAGGKEEDGLYERAQPIERTLDLARSTPMLTLQAADEISVAQPSMRIELSTADPGVDLEASTAAPQPIELPVTVAVGGKSVALVETHAGHASVEVPVTAFGRPGSTAQLMARFAGDPLRNPAEAAHAVRVTTPTQLTLAASSTELPWRGSIELTGRLGDALGPVAGAEVEIDLSDGSRTLLRARTDGEGRFRARLEGGRERPGTLFVEARLGTGPWFREPSRSPAIALTLLAPEPRALGFWVSPLATALALGLGLLLRRKPWRALAERRARAPRRQRDQPLAGLTESRPRLLSTLRPATDHGVSGFVVELPALRPVATATVTVRAGARVETRDTDDEGRFSVEDLPAGAIEIEVAAPGYVGERFRRALPHRGELRQARITLVPIRERIFAAYRAVALPLLPEARLAETWTPRELVRHVARSRLLVDELDAFTRFVETAYFGPRLPDAAVLAEAERLAAVVSARATPSSP